MSKWEYGGAYHQYDMNGEISLPNDSILKVCDLTKELPNFMLRADTIFCDPPCSQGNLQSFHTKSDSELTYTFSQFETCLFERLAEIKPKHLFLEVFKSNKERVLEWCKQMYVNVVVYDSFYYKNRKNKCWIIYATNEPILEKYSAINDIDEEKAIEWICKNHDYNVIGDLCMGTGLVGKYAFQSGKTFVGTELNKKRLAKLVDFCKKQ